MAQLPLEEFLDFIGKLPPHVASCSFSPDTGTFSLTFKPNHVAPAAVEGKPADKKPAEEKRRIRDTESLAMRLPDYLAD